MPPRSALVVLPLLVGLAGAACDGGVCAPGQQIACACGGGEDGFQVCAADGQSFGACDCGSGGAGGSGGSGGSGGAAGGGGQVSCQPGMQYGCYGGPAGTEQVGACTAGTALCLADGMSYGPCIGEVTPQPETCDTPVDDDCDGEVNEDGVGCVCTPDAIGACYEGPAGTEDVGICVGGVRTCNDQGTAWGPCEGQVLPQTDFCATPADDDCSGSANDCVASAPWSKSFDGTSENQGVSLANDLAGNVFVHVACSTDTDLGGGPLAGLGGCLGKFSGAGAHLWSKSVALQGGIPGDVAVDAAGNLLWVGGFSQFIDFGGGSHFVNDPAQQSYLVKYAADGTYAWSKAFGDPSSFDVAWDVATDGAGNVFVLGSFNNTFDVGLGPLTSAGLSDLYLIKLAPDGTPLWAKSYGTAQANEGMGAVATDSAGNVYLHVQHWASGSYGGMPLPSTGPGNIAIAKYDPQGNHVWSKSCTGSPSGAPTSLAIDASDNLLLTGTFEQTLDCGGGNPLVGGSQNTYVIKLDPLGNYLWGIAPSVAPSSTTIQDVAVDAFGNVYLAGFFSGVVDFGGVLMAPTMPWSAFSVKLSPAGAHLASAKYGAGATAFDVGVDAVGSVFLVGSFSNAIDLGAGVLTAPPNLKSAFLARLP